MITETSDKKELLAAIEEAVNNYQDLLASLDDNNINSIPYPGSWTAGQLVQHVTKSIGFITKAMQAPSKAAERNPGEKIAHLKNIFLDFSKKMNSPDFIFPDEGPYTKQISSNGLNEAFAQFKESANNANLNDIVDGLPFGPTTKLEILHFVLYHTQRHLQQMKNICAAIA